MFRGSQFQVLSHGYGSSKAKIIVICITECICLLLVAVLIIQEPIWSSRFR